MCQSAPFLKGKKDVAEKGLRLKTVGKPVAHRMISKVPSKYSLLPKVPALYLFSRA
jgi:hypothetical protein